MGASEYWSQRESSSKSSSARRLDNVSRSSLQVAGGLDCSCWCSCSWSTGHGTGAGAGACLQLAESGQASVRSGVPILFEGLDLLDPINLKVETPHNMVDARPDLRCN